MGQKICRQLQTIYSEVPYVFHTLSVPFIAAKESGVMGSQGDQSLCFTRLSIDNYGVPSGQFLRIPFCLQCGVLFQHLGGVCGALGIQAGGKRRILHRQNLGA